MTQRSGDCKPNQQPPAASARLPRRRGSAACHATRWQKIGSKTAWDSASSRPTGHAPRLPWSALCARRGRAELGHCVDDDSRQNQRACCWLGAVEDVGEVPVVDGRCTTRRRKWSIGDDNSNQVEAAGGNKPTRNRHTTTAAVRPPPASPAAPPTPLRRLGRTRRSAAATVLSASQSASQFSRTHGPGLPWATGKRSARPVIAGIHTETPHPLATATGGGALLQNCSANSSRCCHTLRVAPTCGAYSTPAQTGASIALPDAHP
jgi:hypothetical protein